MTMATSVRLSDETGRKLDELAARTGRSKSFYVRQAVEDNIDRLIAQYDILARVEEVRHGARTFSRAELERLLSDVEG